MNPPTIIVVVVFCAVAAVLVGASLHRLYKRTHTDQYGREMRIESWNPNYYPQDQVERLGEVRRITNMQIWQSARAWRREASPESRMTRQRTDRSMDAIAFEQTENPNQLPYGHLDIPNAVGTFAHDDESDSDAYGMPALRRVKAPEPAAVVRMKRWTQHGAPRRSQMMNNPVLTLNNDTENLIEQGPNSYELQPLQTNHPIHRSSSIYSESVLPIPAPPPARLPAREVAIDQGPSTARGRNVSRVQTMVQQWENVRGSK